MKIATHNGPFHADDVFALAILTLIHPEASIIRTRNVELLASADLRVDVGMIHDPKKGCFDHHQGAGVRDNSIPYAAAGLVWKHYAHELVDKDVQEKLDKRVFQCIDATDTGIAFPLLQETIEPYTVSLLIESYNQQWDEEPADQFEKAVMLAQEIIRREITKAQSEERAINVVREALKKYEHEKYFVLEKYVPWKRVATEESDTLFCIHPGTDGNWNAVAVSAKTGSFENRKDFPKAWAGLEGDALAQVTGVQDALFCHRNLFICVARTKEGALRLVNLAITTPIDI